MKSKKSPAKNVVNIFNAFQELREIGAKEDLLFQRIKSIYETLNNDEKEDFFRTIIETIEVSKELLSPLLGDLVACNAGDPNWPKLLSDLRQQTYSPRLNLFRKISRSPGGLKFLLDFRRDLLSIQRFSKIDLKPLDSDIILLFELMFQDGFLYLEEITLDSSYRQLELIKNSDLVHPMTSIEEMGQRLGKDRICFALYHRLIPYEPVIFIEVALTRGIVESIAEIINIDANRTSKRDADTADTAIFYSINNTQQGLTGLGLGKMLIGQVVDYLRRENEQIKNFATLSPLPGFWKNYLRPILEGHDDSFTLKYSDLISFFSKRQVNRIMTTREVMPDDPEHFNSTLLSVLSGEEWIKDEEMKRILRNPLNRIAYHYISKEKNIRNKPLNAVANFHLENGATVSPKNVNFLANPSNRGLKESCGTMVNYIYTSTWLSQIRRSFGWFDKMEIKGIFSRSH
ncbi:MAG: malonyl-CoA decarboxylase family protein [Thermodesulfobacteriota bacterium]|nr:malonyl-CoA decarboxylase family protein [Thermodesulfobacteriota bacterium]